MTNRSEIAERPNTIPWPPILLLCGIAIAAALGSYSPLNETLPFAIQVGGYAILAIGIVFDFSAIYTMWRAKTNILPHLAAKRLITTGPFYLTRNPIYVGNTASLFGMSLAFSNLWYAIAATFIAVLVDRLAIRREERHLEARFGSAWAKYESSTPRWLT
jgi:protein-S-isoprenylcysteine O-methyltransferase Ste14